MRRAAARFWTAFHPHREVSTTLGISAVAHLIILLGITSAIYDSGKDDADVPELSVQLDRMKAKYKPEDSYWPTLVPSYFWPDVDTMLKQAEAGAK
jgi:hypothetical protein